MKRTDMLAQNYFANRRHQAALAALGRGMLTTYPSGRTELSYASAPYGKHALSAFIGAKRSLFFRQELIRKAAGAKRRSKAAKAGWRTRRERMG